MFDSEGLSRKKRGRAAHRGSVTRFVNHAYEVLRAEDGHNVQKLKQQKHPLSEKLDILLKLDNQLIELIRVGELEEVVEQADKVREK